MAHEEAVILQGGTNMAINTNSVLSNIYGSTYKTTGRSDSKATQKSETEEIGEAKDSKSTDKVKESASYGRKIGEPKLSKEAAKYYEKLKQKYGNYDFILVSEDQKQNAQANAAKYANSSKTVVLIDEDKIEKMATDENYRKKYEEILSGASAKLQDLKSSMEKSGASVQGYGMQVNDGGTASFFAVLKKSSSDQKARIEKGAEKKKAQKQAEKKATEKKAAEKKAEKKEHSKLEKSKSSNSNKTDDIDYADDTETVTITANSIEELMKKIEDYSFAQKSDNVQTAQEKMIGQRVDFRG